MNRNPLMPFGLIAVLGIILMVGISYYGLNNADRILAAKEEKAKQTEEAAPVAEGAEGIYSASCASCHGQNLEGGVGPDLTAVGGKLAAEDIANIINNGQNAMPAGLVDAAKAEELAAWLAEKK